MKYSITFLLAACLCLCSCESLFHSSDQRLEGLECATFWEILTEPDLGMITVGKEGGEIDVLAYVHELNPADSVSRAHKLKNEYFYFGEGSEGKKIEEFFPFVSLKSREQVDDYTVRYTFSFLANDTNQDRNVDCRIYDLTYYKDYNDNKGMTMAGIGYLKMTQTAE